MRELTPGELDRIEIEAAIETAHADSEWRLEETTNWEKAGLRGETLRDLVDVAYLVDNPIVLAVDLAPDWSWDWNWK